MGVGLCCAGLCGVTASLCPGWIKTFDKYYYDQTQHILNSMVLKMQEDPRRRFIWSEISFFSKWWDNISSQKRAAVRRCGGQGLGTPGWSVRYPEPRSLGSWLSDPGTWASCAQSPQEGRGG